jgi:hypothetical protein
LTRPIAAARRRAEKPEVDAVDAELRGLGGIGEVAGGDQLAAGGDGCALHPGDDRLRTGPDRLHHRAAAGEQVLEPRLVGNRPHLREVVAGAEDPAVRGDDDHPHLRVGGGRGDGVVEGRDHRGGEGVGPLRPVEGERRDAVGTGHGNVRARLGC